jgi:hypothetical protein
VRVPLGCLRNSKVQVSSEENLDPRCIGDSVKQANSMVKK